MEWKILKICVLLTSCTSLGATYKTTNFVVDAPTLAQARQVAEAAEHYRTSLAKDWFGKDIPDWTPICPIVVDVHEQTANGLTSYSFRYGKINDWNMRVEGPMQDVLDSVLPHEVTHLLLANHFGRPLPRWADEGIALFAEGSVEQLRHKLRVKELVGGPQQMPLRRLLSVDQYPSDSRALLRLYASGYAFSEFLIERGGKAHFLAFLNDANREGWDEALRGRYGFTDVESCESQWGRWLGSITVAQAD